jgi:hypothetical protein
MGTQWPAMAASLCVAAMLAALVSVATCESSIEASTLQVNMTSVGPGNVLPIFRFQSGFGETQPHALPYQMPMLDDFMGNGFSLSCPDDLFEVTDEKEKKRTNPSIIYEKLFTQRHYCFFFSPFVQELHASVQHASSAVSDV